MEPNGIGDWRVGLPSLTRIARERQSRSRSASDFIVESLQALLSHAIDYAGLFPPANLPLREAAERFAQYLNDADAWMLARFVCPVDRLHELTPPAGSRWRIAAIGRAANGGERCLTDGDDQLRQVASFQEEYARQTSLELFEMPMPRQIATEASPTELESFFANSVGRIAAAIPELSGVLFELNSMECGSPRGASIATAMAAVNSRLVRDARPPYVGLKLRLGGTTAGVTPSSEQIARQIACCRDARLRWKATAGLHHPLRHLEPSTSRPAQGFINLLAAAVFSAVHSLTPLQLGTLLDEDRASHFDFQDDGLSWRDWRVSTEQIRGARATTMLAFGSCSFDEPREGLRQLGWLEGNR
jgi:hypothetical protein